MAMETGHAKAVSEKLASLENIPTNSNGLFSVFVSIEGEVVSGHETGDTATAAAQLRVALGNVIAQDPAWSLAEREFEISITGRTADRVAERLKSRLAELEN